MATAVPSLEAPEFKSPPTPNFYSSKEFPGHYLDGMLSPYGEQLLFVAEHLVSANGVVDGPTMLQDMVAWAGEFGGRPDHALTTMMQDVDKGFPHAGADDHQAHCFLKAIPVTCLYAAAGNSEVLLQQVEDAVRVHQNNEMAVTFAKATALLLQPLLLGETKPGTSAVIKSLPLEAQVAWKHATDATGGEYETLVSDVGRSCALPGSFIAPAYWFQQTYDENTNAYVTALRQNILAAGDTCSRAILIGAVLAAAGHEPPPEWVDKVDKATMERIDAVVDKLANIAMEIATTAAEQEF
eukprot:scaffold44656_cov168-Amphora_coffeaeformis.AAC.1